MDTLYIEVEPLKKNKLYIAAPCYGGGSNINFTNSCIRLGELLLRCGIQYEFSFMGNESLIQRARNRMVNWFLQKEGFTHLMFIDSDIEFDPQDVVALMHFDKDVIGGTYPLKAINWEQVKKALQKHPDISPEDLAICGSSWASHMFEGHNEIKKFEPVEVPDLATGFMMIKREVFEALKPHTKEFSSAPNEYGMTPRVNEYFPTPIVGNDYLSEDYGFCHLWKSIGGKIHMCPWMKLNHMGTYKFPGDMLRVVELLGEIH